MGYEPLKQLHGEIAGPIATPKTQGVWYQKWRLVSLDGSTLDVADRADNAAQFGRVSVRVAPPDSPRSALWL